MKAIVLLLCVPVLLLGQNKSSRVEPYQVGDHELLLMPTAYTMEKGQSYLSDYEVIFLNYTFAPAAGTHISIMTIFPITTHFLETLTLGVKQQLFANEVVSNAAWATYTPDGGGLTLGDVFSLGKKTTSFHIGLGGIKDVESKSDFELVYMLGFRADISKKFSFLTEYTNLESGFENDFGGLWSVGIRFRGESISWDLAGIRPLEETGDFLFFPLIKATYVF